MGWLETNKIAQTATAAEISYRKNFLEVKICIYVIIMMFVYNRQEIFIEQSLSITALLNGSHLFRLPVQKKRAHQS